MPLDTPLAHPTFPRARLLDRVQMHPTPDQLGDTEWNAWYEENEGWEAADACYGHPDSSCYRLAALDDDPLCQECLARARKD